MSAEGRAYHGGAIIDRTTERVTRELYTLANGLARRPENRIYFAPIQGPVTSWDWRDVEGKNYVTRIKDQDGYYDASGQCYFRDPYDQNLTAYCGSYDANKGCCYESQAYGARSCVAFAIVAAAESNYLISKTPNGQLPETDKVDFSEGDLFYRGWGNQQFTPDECNGCKTMPKLPPCCPCVCGWKLGPAFSYLQNDGLGDEAIFIWDPWSEKWPNNLSYARGSTKWFGEPNCDVGLEVAKNWLMNRGPLVTTLDWYDSNLTEKYRSDPFSIKMELYDEGGSNLIYPKYDSSRIQVFVSPIRPSSTGAVPPPQNDLVVRHTVCIVGFCDTRFTVRNINANQPVWVMDDSHNKKLFEGYWIVKNSMGPNWGHDGYLYIAYDECNIGTAGFHSIPRYGAPHAAVMNLPSVSLISTIPRVILSRSALEWLKNLHRPPPLHKLPTPWPWPPRKEELGSD